MNPEELLAHSDFVHALAHSLVLDENSAADIEQQAWLAAMEHPPLPTGSRTAWFSKVIRNFARMMHRTEQRRTHREQFAARPERIPSSDEIVEMMETRRRLIDAVLALDDPYRTAIVFRYYEDLKPGEIARKLNLPVETVRTRIKRGLEQLRVRLDERYEGRRNAWCLALTPLAGLQWKASSATAVGGTLTGASAALPGVLIMSMKLKVVIATVVLLGLGIGFWQLYDPSPIRAQPMPEDSRRNTDADMGLTDVEETVQSGEAKKIHSARPTSSEKTYRDIISPDGILLTGVVVDKSTGFAVDIFQFRLLRESENGNWEDIRSETVRNIKGRFELPLEEGGNYDIQVQSPNHRWERTLFSIHQGTTEKKLILELDAGLSVHGLVVDDATDEPVVGALVKKISYLDYNDELIRIQQGKVACTNYAVTDAVGCFSLSGLTMEGDQPFELLGKWILAASHTDFAEGRITIEADTDRPVEIRLPSGYRIHGKAFDDSGHPAAGILISMVSEQMPMARGIVTGEDGSYRSPPLNPGRVYLHALQSSASNDTPVFTEERKWIDMEHRDVEVSFGPSPDHVTWRGSLQDSAGKPISRGRVILVCLPIEKWDAYRFNQRRTVECDSEGRFEIRKLMPGTYRVTLRWTSECEWGKITFDTPGVVERNLKVPGGTISGILIDGVTRKPLVNHSGYAHMKASAHSPVYRRFMGNIDAQGRFTLQGLPAGTYELAAVLQDYPYQVLQGIDLKADGMVENVQFTVFPGGKLHLRLEGFADAPHREIKYALIPSEGLECYFPEAYLDTSGQWEIERTLTTGTWTLQLTVPELGYLTRTFEIERGKTAEITIRENDLSHEQGFHSISGSLTRRDGTPVPGAMVVFFGPVVNGMERDADRVQGKTGSEGLFTLSGLKAGRWEVYAQLANGDDSRLPDTVIPTGSSGPITLHLIFPEGVITGELYNKLTGKLLTGQELKWWIRLSDVKSSRTVNELRGDLGTRFRLTGIPEGEYELHIHARGYQWLTSDPIVLAEGRIMDLGKIGLDPCGVLEIAVIDDLGESVDAFTLTCDGDEISPYSREELSPGGYRYFHMPLGRVTITVSADGYEMKSGNVELQPGETVELEFRLSRL